LNFVPSRYDDLSSAIASACDRFVHPSVAGEAARLRSRRFVGTMLFAPIVMMIAAALLLPGRLGASVTLAAVLILFAVSWLAVLVAAGLRASRWLEAVALIAGVPLSAALVMAAGGLASPMSLLLLALPLEAYWVARTRTALAAGAAALAGAVGLEILGASAWPALAGDISAWHWLVPLAYAATLWPRSRATPSAAAASAATTQRQTWHEMIDGVVLDLTRAGDVIAVSDKCRETLNLAPELLHGTGLFDRVHVADRVRYMCALSELRDGKAAAQATIRLRLPKASGESGPDDFQPFTIDFYGAEGGAGFTAVLRDKTEIERLRVALHAAKDETEALDIAKGRFLAAVSHELRTPLNAIIGFSDILLHEMFGGFTDRRQREYSELIKESGHHLLSIVNAILDVSKIESGAYAIHTESFTFGDAVEMCRSMMSLQAEKRGIDLRTQIGRSVGDIVADRRAVQQILINLVSNAVKFTPEKGSVVIGAQRLGSRLHFWVADTGIGIAEEDLDRIGRPFTQVRNDYTRQFEGTGLGLSLVKGLVALHEGTMSIESAPGEGTKVAISLPIDGPARQGGEDRVVDVPALQEVNHGTLRKTA
jgi:cell cycle sensor histidine kinase DivJ